MASEAPHLAQTGYLNMARSHLNQIFETEAIPADREKFPGTVDFPLVGRVTDPMDRAQRLAVTTDAYKSFGYISTDKKSPNYLPVVNVDLPFEAILASFQTSADFLTYVRSKGGNDEVFDSYLFGDGIILRTSGQGAEGSEIFFDKHVFHSYEYGVRINGQIVASARVIDQNESPTLSNEKLRGSIQNDLLDEALNSGGEISQFARDKDFDKKGLFLPWLIKAIFVDSKRRGVNTLTMNIDSGLQTYLNGMFSLLGKNNPPGLTQLGTPVMHLGSMTTTWLLNIANTEKVLAGNINYFRNRLATEPNQTEQRTRQLEQQVMLCLLLGGFENGVPSMKAKPE